MLSLKADIVVFRSASAGILCPEAVFVKHQYSKPKKRKIQSVEEFDPRPPEFRGTASKRMPEPFLEEIRGDNLFVFHYSLTESVVTGML